MATLVLGLGNPILADDSAGLKIVRALHECISNPEITVLETGAVGLDLLDILAGFDRAVIVDAIQTRGGRPGQIYHFGLDTLHLTLHTASSHGIDLLTAIELGKSLGMQLPQHIEFFAIEVADITTCSEQCTAEVEKAIGRCVKLILNRVDKLNDDPQADPVNLELLGGYFFT